MEALEILQRTRMLLSQQAGLAVGRYRDSETGNLCLKGALRMAATDEVYVLELNDSRRPAYMAAYSLLLDAMNVRLESRPVNLDLDDIEIAIWNDEHTKTEAIALVDKAIALASR